MIASDPNEILMSPTNNSPSKAHYSFGKAPRFPSVKSPTQRFYEIPVSLSKRSTNFGYGKKSDFTSSSSKTPDPGLYNVQSDIKLTGKGFTFGISRESSKSQIKGHFIADPVIPGPGSYNILPKFGRESRNIVMTGRISSSKSSNNTPGPGSYNEKFEITKGNYVLSTHKNQSVHSFSPPNQPRFPKLNLDNLPAPGSYDVDKGFLKNSEVLSNFTSTGSRKFPLSAREFMKNINESPGPGSYRMPSEFGHY